MRNKLYGDDPYGRAATPESLALLKVSDLKSLYEKHGQVKFPVFFYQVKYRTKKLKF